MGRWGGGLYNWRGGGGGGGIFGCEEALKGVAGEGFEGCCGLKICWRTCGGAGSEGLEGKMEGEAQRKVEILKVKERVELLICWLEESRSFEGWITWIRGPFLEELFQLWAAIGLALP